MRGLNPHRHDDVAVIPAFLAHGPEEALRRLVLERQNEGARTHRLQKIEKVFRVESDLERLTRVLDINTFRGLSNLGIIGRDLDASLAQRDADRTRTLARQKGDAAHHLRERGTVQLEKLVVSLRDDLLEIGKFSRDDRRAHDRLPDLEEDMIVFLAEEDLGLPLPHP